jgi:tRNA-dihydrouridine synthase B
MPAPQLTDPWELGSLRVPNRVLLAPLAGIGNWFVRLQAKRHGAGMAVSEMVSSHAIHYRNERTLRELLHVHPDERIIPAGIDRGEGIVALDTDRGVGIVPLGIDRGEGIVTLDTDRGEGIVLPGADHGAGVVAPTSIQLFGSDPDVMRSAAASAVAAGADAIDLNMGCPVPKVCKTGAGAALLADPRRAVAVARAAVDGGVGVPVTVKLRSGQRPGDTSGFELAHRLVEEAGVAAIAFHPRSAAVHHKGVPDYALAARLAESLSAPVILTGGMNDAEGIRETFARTGVAAVMLARGCLGNPWLFEELVGRRESAPTPAEVLAELDWVIDRACLHLGPERAARYLRKFYPWYLPRLGLDRTQLARLQELLQASETLADAREILRLGAEEGGSSAAPARGAAALAA